MYLCMGHMRSCMPQWDVHNYLTNISVVFKLGPTYLHMDIQSV